MFWHRKNEPEPPRNLSDDDLSLAALEARVRRMEALLAVPGLPDRRYLGIGAGLRHRPGSLAAALASLGRAIDNEAKQRL